MKLLTKTTLINSIILFLILLAGGFAFYIILRSIINDEVDEKLMDNKQQVTGYIKTNHKIDQNLLIIGEKINIIPISQGFSTYFNDTLLYDDVEKEMTEYRQISFSVNDQGQEFKVTISKPSFEAEDLVLSIICVLLIIIGSLVVVFLLLNYFVFKKTWEPFNNTLDKIMQFNLVKGEIPDFTPTNIKEFHQLNDVLRKLTEKMLRDYCRMKEFSENASHELQTPLSVMKSTLELLVQTRGLTEEQANYIQDLSETVERLSRINTTLILLARIENRQFHQDSAIDLSKFIKEKIDFYTDLLEHKNISVNIEFAENPDIIMDKELADILLTNLLSNAIRHNINNGQINIQVNNQSFTISNTGTPLSTKASELFERFKKDDQSSKSLGLGLAIVKQIADSYNFQICYDYAESLHRFRMNFRSKTA